MASFQGNKTTTKPSDPYVTDWARVMKGLPFYIRGWSDAEVERHTKPLPGPIEVGLRDADGNIREPALVDQYPSGVWKIRSDVTGKSWWMHIDIHRRGRMPQFRRKAGTDGSAQ